MRLMINFKVVKLTRKCICDMSISDIFVFILVTLMILCYFFSQPGDIEQNGESAVTVLFEQTVTKRRKSSETMAIQQSIHIASPHYHQIQRTFNKFSGKPYVV